MAQPLYVIHRRGRHRIAQRERWARRQSRRRPGIGRGIKAMLQCLMPAVAAIAIGRRFGLLPR